MQHINEFKFCHNSNKFLSFSKNSKREKDENKCYQINLHLDINELIPFPQYQLSVQAQQIHTFHLPIVAESRNDSFWSWFIYF